MFTTIRGPASSPAVDRETVRDALRRALLAPSEHNAQPWLWTRRISRLGWVTGARRGPRPGSRPRCPPATVSAGVTMTAAFPVDARRAAPGF